MSIAIAAAVALAAFNFAAPVIASQRCGPGKIVIKVSHDVAETYPKGVAAKMLAAKMLAAWVNKEMDGIAGLDTYPNSRLYDDNKVFEAMLLGDVQLRDAAMIFLILMAYMPFLSTAGHTA